MIRHFLLIALIAGWVCGSGCSSETAPSDDPHATEPTNASANPWSDLDSPESAEPGTPEPAVESQKAPEFTVEQVLILNEMDPEQVDKLRDADEIILTGNVATYSISDDSFADLSFQTGEVWGSANISSYLTGKHPNELSWGQQVTVKGSVSYASSGLLVLSLTRATLVDAKPLEGPPPPADFTWSEQDLSGKMERFETIFEKLSKREGIRASIAGVTLEEEVFAEGSLPPEVLSEIQAIEVPLKISLLGSSSKISTADYEAFAQLPWLRDVLVWGPKITDEQLRALTKAPNLRSVIIDETAQLTDAGLVNLANLRWLETLQLGRFPEPTLTEAGVKHFTQLPWLSRVDLAGFSNMNDTGLEALATLPRLEDLDASSTKATGVGLAAFADHPQLTALNLSHCPLEEAGILHLARIPKLTFVNLAGTADDPTKISLAAAKALADCPRLCELQLSKSDLNDEGLQALAASGTINLLIVRDTNITSEGLKSLKSLKSLEYLFVDDEVATPAIQEELKQALPDLKFNKPKLRSHLTTAF